MKVNESQQRKEIVLPLLIWLGRERERARPATHAEPNGYWNGGPKNPHPSRGQASEKTTCFLEHYSIFEMVAWHFHTNSCLHCMMSKKIHLTAVFSTHSYFGQIRINYFFHAEPLQIFSYSLSNSASRHKLSKICLVLCFPKCFWDNYCGTCWVLCMQVAILLEHFSALYLSATKTTALETNCLDFK